MPENPAKKYLQGLRDKPAERERLRGAVHREVVSAGQAAGYTFTEQDLEELELRDCDLGWGGHPARVERAQALVRAFQCMRKP